jgi:hypothetical protein
MAIMTHTTRLLTVLALALVPALSACTVGGDEQDSEVVTDDADETLGGVQALVAHANPAAFDLHCLWAGESYASRAPNQYAADAIRAACNIQAARIPYHSPGFAPWQLGEPTANKGVDCSGMSSHVWYVATNGWVRLPHSAAAQERALHHVSWSEMLPGDLLFYVSAAALSGRHVAMYLGDGLMIEAAGSSTGVVVSKARSNVSSIGRIW